jgi:hypothetical protein
MKPYLLIVNDQYYPSHGTGDWRNTYETEDEAHSQGDLLTKDDEQKSFTVVDLRSWL